MINFIIFEYMNRRRIILKKELGQHLQTRESARKIVGYFENDNQVLEIDFSDVNEISRSFMDEFVKVINEYKDKIYVDFNSLSETKTILYKTVLGTNNITERKEYQYKFAHHKLTDISELYLILNNF